MTDSKPPEADRAFAGSIPQLYERHLVPLIFADQSQMLGSRAGPFGPEQPLGDAI